MRPDTRTSVVVLSALGLLVAWPAAAFEKSQSAEGLTDLAVETQSGAVELVGWDQPQVKVEWTDPDPAQAPRFRVEAGKLRIGGEPRLDLGLTADLKIHLPAGLKASVKTISGDLSARGLQAGCRLVSISGEVKVQDLAGGVEIKLISGDVEAKNIRGDLAVKAVSGEVEAQGVGGGLVEIKSVSGDIDLSGELGKVRAVSHSGEIDIRGKLLPDGGLQAKSFSGDVDLWLPAGAGFDLIASTRSGSVKVEPKLQAAEISGNKASGRADGGGPEVELSSFSGDIAVRIAK